MLHEAIGKAAMYEQAAEECCELSQACLKRSRLIRGENMPHKTPEEIEDDLIEELADVLICIEEIYSMQGDPDVFGRLVIKQKQIKTDRMKRRLENPGKIIR